MENLELLLKNLIGKSGIEAEKAAAYLINTSDLKLFKMLVDKSDYLFDFVRNNINKRISKVIDNHNFMNVVNFFEIYSPYYDDLFAEILSKNANQDLTDEMFDLLEKGSQAQKTYAAKYFVYIPDTVAIEPLEKYAFSDDENLSFNSAQALGQMNDDISFDIALSSLESDDDFDKLKAVKFFTAYGCNYPLKEIFMAMKNSKMPENIAGQIPYTVSLVELLDSEYKLETLIAIDYILSGLGEILSLSDIFQFELYEIFSKLISINNTENEFSGKISEILLSAKLKFEMFTENQEYIFDEDKNTKNEIFSILELLKNQKNDFWNNQKIFIIKELDSTEDRVIASLPIIKDYKIVDSIEKLKQLLNSENEIIVYESLNALKVFGEIGNINLSEILSKIKNPNIKAMIENI